MQVSTSTRRSRNRAFFGPKGLHRLVIAVAGLVALINLIDNSERPKISKMDKICKKFLTRTFERFGISVSPWRTAWPDAVKREACWLRSLSKVAAW